MSQDKLLYFGVRARAEPIRMLYGLAGKQLTDEIMTFERWGGGEKVKQPLGQLPLYTCPEGELLMSNSIARYAARQFGMMGSTSWEEAVIDMIVETCLDIAKEIPSKIYIWKVFKFAPEPENSVEAIAGIRERMVAGLNFIQGVAEKRGNKFIVTNEISLADIWLFSLLEFSKTAFPDIMEVTPWVIEFVEKFRSDQRVKKYLSERADSPLGI